jgi:hypothetical protein
MDLITEHGPDRNLVVQFFCKACCTEYFVSIACAPQDSGRCWRCDEVAELEALLRK